MALIQKHQIIVFGQDIEYPKAYHKVSSLFATNEVIRVNVEIYNDDSKEHIIDNVYFEFNSISFIEIDLIQLAYRLIKTLPDYVDAIDVFEEGQPV